MWPTFCRMAAVHLVDAHLCGDGAKYISALLMSLNAMMSLELPHINVLSKMDLVDSIGELAFNLDFYTEVFPALRSTYWQIAP